MNWKMGCSGKGKSELGCVFLVLILYARVVEPKCSKGCDLALASFYLWNGANLTFISRVFSTSIDEILSFNPHITNSNYIIVGARVNIPIPCDCIDGEFLGHKFVFTAKPTATYRKVARLYLANLTTVDSLRRINSYDADFVANVSTPFNVTLDCFCGNKSVSRDYGLFTTYPLHDHENLFSVARASVLPLELLQRYNYDTSSRLGKNLIFLPGKDQTGRYPPLVSRRSGARSGIIIGISAIVAAWFLLLGLCLYCHLLRRKKLKALSSYPVPNDHDIQNDHDFSVKKALEYSYGELAEATNNFSINNKIGQGCFGAVYYAELRGERAAIKKMDMQASKEFLAELKVLSHVHHLNLVRLLGYCTRRSLFLVYEFIENGNLSQNLRTERKTLPWSSRVRIALDSARGLEYIHEHTVPVYVHRDIKSANILIDKSSHAKVILAQVADFGLAKLTEVGRSVNTPLVGTFGYMPPEYGHRGDISPKIDVYAFGVVVYELISAQDAIVKTNEIVTSLVSLFEDAFAETEPLEHIQKLVDPRLGNDYPVDSLYKMALLARACTQVNPKLRPTMRSVVVELMSLLSSTGDWGVGGVFCETNHCST